MKSRPLLRLQQLPWLLNEMQSGRLIVPAFQRRFVWSKSQVKNLLDSIYHGYPIGTILLFEERTRRWPSLPPEQSEFPQPKKSEFVSVSPNMYVIDGSQRLAALYNAFFGDRPGFAFAFDLKNKKFVNADQSQYDPTFVNLRKLFSSEGFFQTLSELREIDDSELLLDNYKDLQSAFMDYELVILVLVDMTVDEAMEVHQRLNTTGRRLSKKDLEKIMPPNP